METRIRMEELLQRAADAGAVLEIHQRRRHERSVRVHQGRLESRDERRSEGVGLRLEREGRVGQAATTDLEPAALQAALDRALEAASVTAVLEAASLPRRFGEEPSLPADADPPSADAAAGGEEAARAAEAAAFAADSRVRKSEGARWREVVEEVRVVSGHGVDRRLRRRRASLTVDVVAVEGGDERPGYHTEARARAEDLPAEWVGREAATKAVSLLGSRSVGTARLPVILHREVVADLLDLMAESFSGEACLAGGSLLADRLGQEVAAASVEIVDDPFHPEGLGGARFDDEGVAAQRTVLVQDGVLRAHLHSSHTGARMGVPSTGNASRGGLGGGVGVAPSNLVLRPGVRDLDALLSGVGEGFLVTGVMGLHMADTASGDFSLGIVGHQLRRGRREQPIEGMTLAGNLLQLWRSVTEVGGDFRFHGDVGCPSLVVEGLTVSGR